MEQFPINIKNAKNVNAWENTITVDPRRIMVYDIETTGVTKFDHITTIAWSIGGHVKYSMFGDDWTEFEEDWRRASGTVTFNGTYFDEKFITKDLALPKHSRHCDLRFFLKAAGRKGGLKKMAEAENMHRPAELADVDGFFAITLWKYYQETGDEEALNHLLAYNIWDVILTAELFKKFVGPWLPTDDFDNPFKINLEKLKRIKDHYSKTSIINE
ncbi:hypothetical protein CMI47_04095 [Candidatus Pacearchaeota archaeon]|jgi:uncharacterized protein YprB with RNaseH-like and TPR domain|nr:hypothetical protein [Candidatus Pacearchaeota archaeon]|tara:strand:- start:6744 stop:7388 length:645 start_codon:yes stop_codon:yes gene_type:complete